MYNNCCLKTLKYYQRHFTGKRLGIISSVLLGLCAISTANAIPPGCTPGPNQVALFQHANYKGICSVLNKGTYKNSKEMRIRNDSTSSILLGSSMEINVCRNTNTGFIGVNHACQKFTKSVKNLKDTRVGNDTISSALVVHKPPQRGSVRLGACRPGLKEIAVYQHPGVKGNCRNLSVGSYANSKQMNFANDSISSIELAPNSKVYAVAYQHGNSGGRKETFSRSDGNLNNNEIGDNSITSIHVRYKRKQRVIR